MIGHNNRIHLSTGFSPFEIVFGRRGKMPSSISNPIPPNPSYNDYINVLKNNLKISSNTAKQKSLDSKSKSKEIYDKKHNTRQKDIKIGDLVKLKNNTKKSKLDNNF
jgi:hypothetical protein